MPGFNLLDHLGNQWRIKISLILVVLEMPLRIVLLASHLCSS